MTGLANSAPVAHQGGRQASEKREFELGSNPDDILEHFSHYDDINGNDAEGSDPDGNLEHFNHYDDINQNDVGDSILDDLNRNDGAFTVFESSPKEDEGNLNLGRRVKMDDYELLKKRTALEGGNVDLMVDSIDQGMESSKNLLEGEVSINKFPTVEDFSLGEIDLVIYLEMKKKIIFMENQMRKHKDQHVAVKPFDKNLKMVKAQFKNLSDKISTSVKDFIKEFLQQAEKFLEDTQQKFLQDNQDAVNKSVQTAENDKKTNQESNAESAENNGRHFHPKFKYFWKKESEDHDHHRTIAESDSVVKSVISNSWFGRSVDAVAVAGFIIVLIMVGLGKWAHARRRVARNKVAKC